MYKIAIILLAVLGILLFQAPAQKKDQVALGAYYFDGWRQDSKHITNFLVDSFPERESTWGWVTSTQAIMDSQINVAADAGLAFFSFCWYYDSRKNKPLATRNPIVEMYLNSPNRERLKYCLMIANHPYNEIGPNDWHRVTAEWIRHFKNDSYITVNGKPLLIIFDINSLITEFSTTENVREAFKILRNTAKKEGLKGVTIAACVPPFRKQITKAEACGYDILTAYNHPLAGFNSKNSQGTPIDKLINAEKLYWDQVPQKSNLPYIPVSTLNWDPRPWAKPEEFTTESYYTGFSSGSVYRSSKTLIDWILQNERHTTKEKIGLLYAWNEYGEGAWLTPSKHSKDNLLDGVKKALNE